jgi:hypothetical protein
MVSCKGACFKQGQYAHTPILLRGHGLVATCVGVVQARACRISILPRARWISSNSLKKLLQKTTVRLCCGFRKSALSAGIVLTQ